MNKLGLIIGREYITKVRNRNFILTTLLTPLGFLIFFVAVAYIFSYDSAKEYNIVVLDQSQANFELPPSTAKLKFSKSDQSLPELKEKYLQKQVDGILVLPRFAGVDIKNYTVYFYADNPMDVEIETKLNNYLGQLIKNQKMALLSIGKEQLEKLETNIIIDPEPVSEGREDQSAHTGKIATAFGGIMGYIIFFIIFLYGASVMRSVAEEKINRIVELIISSASATELMLGKIIGVGLVGLTQIGIWLVLIPTIYVSVMSLAGLDAQSIQEAAQNLEAASSTSKLEKLSIIAQEISMMNWWKIVPLLILYFIGGYLTYAAMFAAIGAAVGDDVNDSQSLTMIISVPIIFAIYIMFQCIRFPESNLAIFSSIFPLFSPIVMPALLAFDPPWWQIIVSILCLFGFVYLAILLTARIYRTAILMYGKKASVKELSHWMFTKQ